MTAILKNCLNDRNRLLSLLDIEIGNSGNCHMKIKNVLIYISLSLLQAGVSDGVSIGKDISICRISIQYNYCIDSLCYWVTSELKALLLYTNAVC